MPHSVEIPAPVNGTMLLASAIKSPSNAIPLCRSDAIIHRHRTTDYLQRVRAEPIWTYGSRKTEPDYNNEAADTRQR